MNHTCKFTPQPQINDSITALWPVLISPAAEGRRLSWPEWLGEIPRWFARTKTVTYSVLASAAGIELAIIELQVQRHNH